MLQLLFILTGIYVAAVTGMFIFQRRLMYYPTKNLLSPGEYGLSGTEVINITSVDGTKLSGWYKPASTKKETIIYFHGNAEHIGWRSQKFHAFLEKGYGLMALNYRGFGTSEGTPDEAGIYDDARSAIRFIKDKGIPESDIIFYGESLGTGVATQMATEFKPKALILEAPYTSVVNRAAEIYFYIPVRFLLRDKFDSISKIGKVTAPVLIMHGEKDAVIPSTHGRKLLAAANEPKKAIFFPETGHADFDSKLLADSVENWVKDNSN